MQWLNKVVDQVVAAKPEGRIVVSSGASPSGTYHFGHLREIITCDAIVRKLKNRGQQASHLHIVDDLDALRKVPANVAENYKVFLGQALCDIPAPDGSNRSYADYFFDDFSAAAQGLAVEMEVIRSSQRYREGFFVPAIEKALANAQPIRGILESISGHKLEDTWSPIQIMEDKYLKKRQFVSLDESAKTLKYLDRDDQEQVTGYQGGEVKLDWRIDWPARWWLLKVDVEPFGRDHATKGGSYDTGAEIIKKVYGAQPPLPVPYDFVNRAGDTKKMSASAGTGIGAIEVTQVLPAEVVRYFMLRYAPAKRLYFDPENITKLIDEYAGLVSSKSDPQLLDMAQAGQPAVVSRVPFTHLVASYQTALKSPKKTIEIISRTELKEFTTQETQTITRELKYIDQWLAKWAPEEVKFELLQHIDEAKFTSAEKEYLNNLGQKVAQAPPDADGEWFHKAIYELKEAGKMTSEQVFKPLYRALIGKDQGPRAGWFLSILPRDWLLKRLRFEE